MSKKKKTKAKSAPPRTFRVWFGQVNQTFIDVKAKDEKDARARGYKMWRRDQAHTAILDVLPLFPDWTSSITRIPVEFENAELGDEG